MFDEYATARRVKNQFGTCTIRTSISQEPCENLKASNKRRYHDGHKQPDNKEKWRQCESERKKGPKQKDYVITKGK